MSRRQGCPLYLALFALVMEPLASTLRQSDAVHDIRIGNIGEKLALYADDIVLFLNNPGPSLLDALTIFFPFADLSSLRVNWEKSLILPIDQKACKAADLFLPYFLFWHYCQS